MLYYIYNTMLLYKYCISITSAKIHISSTNYPRARIFSSLRPHLNLFARGRFLISAGCLSLRGYAREGGREAEEGAVERRFSAAPHK